MDDYKSPQEGTRIVVFDETSAERLVALIYDLAHAVDLLFWNRRKTLASPDDVELKELGRIENALRNPGERPLPF